MGGSIKLPTGKRAFSVSSVAVDVIGRGTIPLFLSLSIVVVILVVLSSLLSPHAVVVIGLCSPFGRFPSAVGDEVVAQWP